MDYPKHFVSNQKEEFISIQRVKCNHGFGNNEDMDQTALHKEDLEFQWKFVNTNFKYERPSLIIAINLQTVSTCITVSTGIKLSILIFVYTVCIDCILG